jgi:hypothetical protein
MKDRIVLGKEKGKNATVLIMKVEFGKRRLNGRTSYEMVKSQYW